MACVSTLDINEITDGFPFPDNRWASSVDVNPNYGAGCLCRQFSPKAGISLFLQNYSIYGDGVVRILGNEWCPPVVSFFTCLSGVRHIEYSKRPVSIMGRLSNVEFTEHESADFMEVRRGTPIQILTVCLDTALFQELTGISCDALSETLCRVDYNWGRKNARPPLINTDFSMKICVSQIIAGFRDADDESFLMEIKALEFVALHLKQLNHLSGRAIQRKTVVPEVEKIAFACEILKKEMANPPGARNLARRVGLNHNQLVRGFKEILGVPPFAYLRAIRLDKAFRLIASHECNVTETALAVGYTSLSHFTKAFREAFGINPRECAKMEAEIKKAGDRGKIRSPAFYKPDKPAKAG